MQYILEQNSFEAFYADKEGKGKVFYGQEPPGG